MSEYRDALPDDETRARYGAGIAPAGQLLAEALADLAELVEARGMWAAAEADTGPAVLRWRRLRRNAWP